MTSQHSLPARTFSLEKINGTHAFVMVQGIVIGLAGMAHGIFATLQGNTPTGGYLLPLGIFTVIPNYLATGVAAIIVGLALIVWTLGFIHKKYGSIIFLALSILLFLVGGGVAQVPFIFLTWGASTQINQPSTWWRKVLAENLRKRLARSWLAIWIGGYIFLFAAIGIWLLLSPPSIASKAPTFTQYILWSFLCIGILFQPLTIVAGLSHDMERQTPSSQSDLEPEMPQ